MIASLLAAGFGWSCADGTSTPELTPGEARSFVYAGELDTGDPNVVGIVNFAGGQCTGSLISPELVLTARHCVADTADKQLSVVCGQTPFNPPDSPGAIFVILKAQITEDPNDYLAVAEIRMPDYPTDDFCGTDVVLLRLAKPITSVSPLVPRVETPVMPNEGYSSVGYGRDESPMNMPAGVRRRRDGLTVSCGGTECATADDVRDNEWVGDGGPCPGDSGGPALDEAGKVIGVVSRGNTGCLNPVFSDVASRADWLEAEAVRAAQLAHDSAPPWAGGPAPAPCKGAQPCSAAGAAGASNADGAGGDAAGGAASGETATKEPAATCGFSPARPSQGASGVWWGLGLVLAAGLHRRRRAR